MNTVVVRNWKQRPVVLHRKRWGVNRTRCGLLIRPGDRVLRPDVLNLSNCEECAKCQTK